MDAPYVVVSAQVNVGSFDIVSNHYHDRDEAVREFKALVATGVLAATLEGPGGVVEMEVG